MVALQTNGDGVGTSLQPIPFETINYYSTILFYDYDDSVFNTLRDTSEDEINKICINSSKKDLKNILSITNEPLVSVDFNHSPYSSNFDLTQTKVIKKKLCRIVSWYDNEWGFANRLIDLTNYISKYI